MDETKSKEPVQGWTHEVLPRMAQEILRKAAWVATQCHGVERIAVVDRAIERVRLLFPEYFR